MGAGRWAAEGEGLDGGLEGPAARRSSSASESSSSTSSVSIYQRLSYPDLATQPLEPNVGLTASPSACDPFGALSSDEILGFFASGVGSNGFVA